MAANTLPVFSQEEKTFAHRLLAARVAHMMGRKLEEGDWVDVYCKAKGLPVPGWSNLNIDVMHAGLGVEQKMMAVPSRRSITDVCGTTLMHPAATRAVRVESTDIDPNQAMYEVLAQYGELIERRREEVRKTQPDSEPDMRTGWLLWQENLIEFLYFEERMTAPDHSQFTAQWVERRGGGARRGSKNLWIYERDTGRKKYSVTTEAGVKIQPYFDVPPLGDPNLYHFVVQGEAIEDGFVRVWLTLSTARDLQRLLGALDADSLSAAILQVEPVDPVDVSVAYEAEVRDLLITRPAYEWLVQIFRGVSDEHRFQLLAKWLYEK